MVVLEEGTDAGAQSAGPQSVGRAMRLLELLAARKGDYSLSALSRDIPCPKSSLLDILRALEVSGHVIRTPKGRYRVGPSAIELGRMMVSQELPDLAEPYLTALVSETGETALVGVLSADGMRSVYVAKVESTNPVRYTVPLNERRELYASAVGKALLANLDDAEIEEYLAREPRCHFTDRTIVDRAALLEELAQVRKTGLAHTEDERVEGASAVAAPVFGSGCRLAAAVVLAGPTSRFAHRRADHGRKVAAVAATLSKLMGCRQEGLPDA